jgi:hypothetical protein
VSPLLPRAPDETTDAASGPSVVDRAAQIKRRGAKEQNRTADTAIFSRMLYLLSYLGMVGETGLEPVTPSV